MNEGKWSKILTKIVGQYTVCTYGSFSQEAEHFKTAKTL